MYILDVGSSLELIQEFKTHMMEAFEMPDLGQLNYFLGLEVVRSFEGVFVKQQRYLEGLLTQFNMLNFWSVTIPMNQNDKLSYNDQ